MSRSRAKIVGANMMDGGLINDQPAPRLFVPGIYDDFQRVLLLLERRVKYGDEDDVGNVGFGLARGTTNTYVIPGMESMSPEEYRERLQETISARQAERRRLAMENSNIIGNRSSSGYLDALSRGGDGGNGGGGSMYKKASWKEDGGREQRQRQVLSEKGEGIKMISSISHHVGNVDVCIVGAGLSGAFAAHLLGLKGLTVAILDSRSRVGGRLLTAGGGRGGDLGGAWIWPGSEYSMNQLIGGMHIETVPMHLDGDAVVRTPDGRRYTLPYGSSRRYAACGDGAVRISGGAAGMVHKLLQSRDDDGEKIPNSSVHLGRRVIRIERDDVGGVVSVIYVDAASNELVGEGATMAIKCRAAILAAPPKVLANTIDFHPPLSKMKFDRMLATPTWMEDYGKVDVSFPCNWWRKLDMSGISIDQGGAVSTWWESCSDEALPSLAGFVTTRGAEHLHGMDHPEDIHDYIMDSLTKLYGVDAAKMGMQMDAMSTTTTSSGSVDGDGLVVRRGGITVTYKSWLKDPNTNTPSRWKADIATCEYGDRYLRQSVGPIFFAGTETSHGNGHMEGAIISARRAADEVIQYLGQSVYTTDR
ncbi:hypothetical protein ACHAXA_009091 [Cyclostephanos tholiformis]|uniref:monoamine oxidase n=1 Tax=Cyclostephanos tholiformis TaxID=382380 RepID=A0ABD3SQE2_9STRA